MAKKSNPTADAGDLHWHTEKRKVKDLVPFEQNPRTLNEDQLEQLKRSLTKFNLVEIPAINTDGKIIAGHMRIKTLVVLGRGEEMIEVRVPSRKLTKKEFEEYNIRSNKNGGSWDMDALANLFDPQDLTDWGFKEGFFNDLLPVNKSDGSGEGRTRRDSNLETVLFECQMLVENRDRFMEVVNKIKQDHGLQTIEEVLMYLTESYKPKKK